MIQIEPLARLTDELEKLPSIGAKSAQRLVFHLLKQPREEVDRLCDALRDVKEQITNCSVCSNITDRDPCFYCTDEGRDRQTICVVEDPRDIVAVERTGEFGGRYHVLGGAISPIEGVGPDQLRIRELLARLDQEGVTEVILATNPNIEGEATAMYLARLLGPLGLEVTKIASGLPVGGDLEYADELTLGRALEGRRRLDGA